MSDRESDLILRLDTKIPSYDVSLNGQTKFYTLCNILLESAAVHANQYRFGYHDMQKENVYWVLSRFHIIMHRYPSMGDRVIVETWPKGLKKLFFMRDYRIHSEDGLLLTTATTAWLVLDGDTGRPRKMEQNNSLHRFYIPDFHAIEQMPGKLPGITGADRKMTVLARYSDLDINKHVNAVKYIEWVQDSYTQELYEKQNVTEFQINYKAETRFGEKVQIGIRTALDPDPFEYLEGIKDNDGNAAFRARIRFGVI
jgi:medium-chain acyl-[acyl-carrier-protein] hydrolase